MWRGWQKNILLAALLWCSPAYTQQPHTEFFKVVIAVGYADDHDSFWERVGFGAYHYFPLLGRDSQNIVANYLLRQGFQAIAVRPGVLEFVNVRTRVHATIAASNVICPDEEGLGEVRRNYGYECVAQRQASHGAARAVEAALSSANALLYLGHARHGAGLSFGNYQQLSARIDIQLIAQAVQNSHMLRLLYIGSCDSIQYYAREILGPHPDYLRLRFLGVQGEPDWREDGIPDLIAVVDTLLQRVRWLDGLPQVGAWQGRSREVLVARPEPLLRTK